MTNTRSDVSLRPMTIDDHAQVLTLMAQTPGIVVRDADGLQATQRYLARNPGLSWVAEAASGHGTTVVGCLMAGHDGRRGYLQHLVVHPSHRGQGVARRMLSQVLDSLQAEGIHKAHVDVLVSHPDGASFWAAMGWPLRTDIARYSTVLSGSSNA
jgi:N-acetylglutamate synthase